MKKLPLFSILLVGFCIAYYQPKPTVIETKKRKSSFSELHFIAPKTVQTTQLASANSASCSIQEPTQAPLSSPTQSQKNAPENIQA